MTARVIWTAALVAPLLFVARADMQSADSPAGVTLRSETRVVQIDVAVTDSHDRPVGDLSKADFSATDEGKRREIAIFGSTRSPADHVLSVASPPQVLPPDVFSNRNGRSPAVSGHSTIIVLDNVNAWFENAAWARRVSPAS